MEVREVCLLEKRGFSLRFEEKESEKALAFILEELEKGQKGFRERLVYPEEVAYAWPTLLRGGEVAITGGGVSKTYARKWHPTTSLFQAVSRKRGGRVHLLWFFTRPWLNSNGNVPRSAYLPIFGLHAWIALGQEGRMREILERRASRRLRAMGLKGKALLVKELPRDGALLLGQEEGEWRLFLAVSGKGIFPLEGWAFREAAKGWALDPKEPPTLEAILRWLGKEHPSLKGITPRKVLKGGWEAVAKALMVWDPGRLG